MTAKFVRFLGSVRLAVPLLVAIAVISIAATFYESTVGSSVVQQAVYKSPWFGALMFLLAVNLGVSTLSRYPWRGPRKIGFALTHWGLIAIIAGSAAVIHLCVEGMLLVRTDSEPNNQVRLQGEVLDVIDPDGMQQQADIFVRADGSIYPPQVGDLSVSGYTESAIASATFANDGAVRNPAVRLRLESDRMGQTLERWLALAPAGYVRVTVGPAQLEIRRAADEDDLERLLSPPSDEAWGTLELKVAGETAVLDVREQLGQTVRLADAIAVRVVRVFPDFRLDADNHPTTVSQEFRNPALQLEVSAHGQRERWFVYGRGFEPTRSGNDIALTASYAAPQITASDYFRIAIAPSDKLLYAARSSQGFKRGELSLGESVTPGWADFRITAIERRDRARLVRRTVPVTPVAAGTMSTEAAPALHVVASDGSNTWLPWGEPATLSTAGGDYVAAFSPKRLQLPFWVKLDDFIVERNEGSDSVAMWTSRVTLLDPQRNEIARRNVWMNHPTWFRGWKLAQASWNPGDLQQSTLQLKREPWWVTALTWSGSLLVVSGIATMFYGPALAKQLRRRTQPKAIAPGVDPGIEPGGDRVEPEAAPIAAGR
ncbi:resB-like family [Rubidibacter lacunae KORDI 51-2]|uniref:ResB-like family n=1 Tax=Rubidibacter lacunae KORDI 51-2 TaxID=582515 RepID=U5DLN1_9CHRO|nr:cytochrome c biogenesis protein ResB [Rubidibacter lacunae]ERN40600.1 resB-like family [Rubidibacter lacunae KORDI 51-2]